MYTSDDKAILIVAVRPREAYRLKQLVRRFDPDAFVMLYLDYGRKPGQWLPNRDGGNINADAVNFLRGLNAAVAAAYPGTMTAAEESTAFPNVTRPISEGGLGFTFKWDMTDRDFAAALESEAEGMLARYVPRADEVYKAVCAKLGRRSDG